MRKIYATLIWSVLFVQASFAQEGWPANYGGVMLQGFYWDSFEDTQWDNLTAQADELSKYFDLIWVPNSANCRNSNSMGYLPVYWFDQRSSFGRERNLRAMIAAYKERGTGIIEDVVVNHKSPLGINPEGSWIDFANETYNGQEITWSGADICKNDDGGYTKSQGWDVTGANDTGEDFSGARDLDHTSANVQKNIKIYLDYLLNDLGYAGFRLDMVKGYGAQYTKIYNEAVKPKFCVGEYWDGSYQALTGWVNGTGKTSAVFDFQLKYAMRDAFGGGNWSTLTSNKGVAGSPDYSRYSVTFVDNHDTYQNTDRLKNNVVAANAFILALPGTPCIFLRHWQDYKVPIANMILARKAAGITNQSAVTESYMAGNGHVMKVQGTKGSVLVVSGYATNYDTNGFTLIASGTNYAYYVSSNVKVEGLLEPEPEPLPDCATVLPGHLYCYFEGNADYTAPNAWVWDANNGNKNYTGGTWPGAKMKEVGKTASGNKVWLWDNGEKADTDTPTGVVFSTGTGSPQTADFAFVNGGYYNIDGYVATVTTGISAPTTAETPADAPVYDLQGRRVLNPTKGLYIVNGRKVIR